MRKIVTILLLFPVFHTWAQINERFEKGSIQEIVNWSSSGQGTDFTLVDGMLRSDARVANSSFFISTSSSLSLACSWEFTVQLKFNTSGANYVDIYLLSDKQDLKSTSINGYFLRIGGVDDEVALYRRSGSLAGAVKITDGVNGTTNSSNTLLDLRITRDETGKFIVGRRNNGILTIDGSVTDITHISTAWFGFYIQQSTSAFHQRHFFDNVSVVGLYEDTTRPTVQSARILDGQTLEVRFSEPVELSGALDILNYELTGEQVVPLSVSRLDDRDVFLLSTTTPLITGTYKLTINNIADMMGNLLLPTVFNLHYIRPYTAKKGDVVINELMVDPSPTRGLPEAEYIEVWNRSSETIMLQNWKLTIGQSVSEMGADTLAPGAYALIVRPADTSLFSSKIQRLAAEKFTSLNNERGIVVLHSSDGVEIDKLEYDSSFYRDVTKKDGGYALELIDPLNKCKDGQNWSATFAQEGGTPGAVNSNYQSQLAFPVVSVKGIRIIDSVSVTLLFDGAPDRTTLGKAENFSINNGVGKATSVRLNEKDPTMIDLIFTQGFVPGRLHTLTVSNVYSCAGMLINAVETNSTFLPTRTIRKGDILINEIMFNPRAEGSDFIELLNVSEDILDLSGLLIANLGSDGEIGSSKRPTDATVLIAPGGYAVLTANVQAQINQYYVPDPANIFHASLPAFPLEKGSVILISNGVEIDHFGYNEKMHAPLLAVKKGVSLERRSRHVSTNDAGAFLSASSTVGYATPGYRNSTSTDDVKLKEAVSLSEKIFSPDGDGQADQLDIYYEFPDAVKMGSMKIFDANGRIMRVLMNNFLLGTKGVVTWNGKGDNGVDCSIGIYIIVLETFELTGRREKFTKQVVLARKTY